MWNTWGTLYLYFLFLSFKIQGKTHSNFLNSLLNGFLLLSLLLEFVAGWTLGISFNCAALPVVWKLAWLSNSESVREGEGGRWKVSPSGHIVQHFTCSKHALGHNKMFNKLQSAPKVATAQQEEAKGGDSKECHRMGQVRAGAGVGAAVRIHTHKHTHRHKHIF